MDGSFVILDAQGRTSHRARRRGNRLGAEQNSAAPQWFGSTLRFGRGGICLMNQPFWLAWTHASEMILALKWLPRSIAGVDSRRLRLPSHQLVYTLNGLRWG
jgi:hypothetical protein